MAFDVKLLESLVALPGIAAFAYLGLPGSRLRRLLRLTAAGAVYVAVALSWLTATLLFPAHDRPYAIGSTNGSAWNAAFVFNGSDRLAGKSPEPGATVYEPGHRYPVATQEERDHIPIVPPSPTRLLARVGPLSGERLGLEVLVALLLGLPALLLGLRGKGEPPRPDPPRGRDADSDGARRAPCAARRRAGWGCGCSRESCCSATWSACTRATWKASRRLVAAMLGIGLAWAAARRAPTAAPPAAHEPRRGRLRLAVLVVALAIIVVLHRAPAVRAHRESGGWRSRRRSARSRCARARARRTAYPRRRARWRHPPA